MDEPDAVRFGQRLAHLPEDVHDAARRQRSLAAHEPLEVDSVEVLHHVIERALGRPAEVVHRHGVRVREPRRQLRLALEAPEVLLPRGVRREELDRRGAPQHLVLGPVDDAHPAFADLLEELVLPEPPGSGDRAAQVEDDVRDQRREHHDERRPERRLRHDRAGDELAGRVRPEDEKRHERDRRDRGRRDPRGAARVARNESGPAEEHGTQDQQHELVGPPGERHGPRHHVVGESRGDRAGRVEAAQPAIGEGMVAGQEPDGQKNHSRHEVKERELLERSLSGAPLRDRVQDDAHQEEAARREARDASEEREPFREKLALARGVRRRERARRRRAPEPGGLDARERAPRRLGVRAGSQRNRGVAVRRVFRMRHARVLGHTRTYVRTDANCSIPG